MEPEFRKNLYTRTANDIHMCKLLCERLIEDNYLDYPYSQLEIKYGEECLIPYEDCIKAAEYKCYMRKQDMELLFKTIVKKGDRWWI